MLDLLNVGIALTDNKNGIDSWTWNITELTVVFQGERGELSRELTNAQERPCVTSQTLLSFPGQFKHDEASGWEAGKVEKTNKQPKHKTQNTMLSSYWTPSLHQVIKSCQHNGNWKQVDGCNDHLQSKAHEEKRENTVLHTLTDSKIKVKGKKKVEFQ